MQDDNRGRGVRRRFHRLLRSRLGHPGPTGSGSGHPFPGPWSGKPPWFGGGPWSVGRPRSGTPSRPESPPWHGRSEDPPWQGPGPDAGPGDRARLPWRSSLALLFFQLVGTQFAAHNQPDRTDVDVLARVLLVLGPALLVLRHRYPRLVVFGVCATLMVYLGAGYPYGPVLFSVGLGCFAAIVAGHRVATWSALGMLWGGHLLITHLLYRWLPPSGDDTAPWGQQLFIAALAVATVAVAELARIRREVWLRERAERAAAARRRADEERLRIARELHDVLAHSISVINVQAGVGLALLDQDPEQARTALTTIKAASKEALGEVRQVLDTLRAPGAAPRSPAPGLDRLGELTEQASGAGLRVSVEVEGVRSALPPGTDLAAFRVIQEALTNIVRHSGSRTARVLLHYTPRELDLCVDDDGPATTGGMTGGGNGLVGMRERAAALGGTVEAGPREDGGFRVRARIPLTAATTATAASNTAPEAAADEGAAKEEKP